MRIFIEVTFYDIENKILLVVTFEPMAWNFGDAFQDYVPVGAVRFTITKEVKT